MDDGKTDPPSGPAGAWYTLPPGTPVLLCSQEELRERAEDAWFFALQGGWVAVRRATHYRVVMWRDSIAMREVIEWQDWLRATAAIYEGIARGSSVCVRRGDNTLLLMASALMGAPLDATPEQIDAWLLLGVPWEIASVGNPFFEEIPLDDTTREEINPWPNLGSWDILAVGKAFIEEIPLDDDIAHDDEVALDDDEA